MLETHRLPEGNRLIVEKIGHPAVYMDNWALNDFSASDTRKARFVSAMKRTGGTLRISVSNVVELLKQSDQTQINMILHLLDNVDTGFINLNFNEVITREDQIAAGAKHGQNPSQEFSLIHAHLLALGWPEHWSVSGIVNHGLKNSANKVFVDSYDSFANRMKKFLDRVRADTDYMNKSLARSRTSRRTGARYCTATRELVVRSLDFILQNKDMDMPAKEWHDLYHTVVPVAYCDIVFIDGRWAEFVSQCGLKPPTVAHVFSRRSIEHGIQAIEEWAVVNGE